MLHDDSLALQRQVDRIAGAPIVPRTVENRVARAFQDIERLPTLEAQTPGAAARGQDLAEKHQGGESRVLDRGVQVPLHLAERIRLDRQFVAANDLDGGALPLAL